MKPMFRSALFKLTASYVLIVMSICIIFSIALDHVAVRELNNGFTNQYERLYDAYERYGLHQPGTPAQELAVRSHHILMQIIYINLLVLIVTTVISYLLARRTLRPIEAAHEQQKRFTADVSHELRTPLTALKMETEVALMDKRTPAKELRETLVSNLEEVTRMEVLINNLLMLSSMEASQVRTVFMRLDTAELAAAAVSSIETAAASRSITVENSSNAIPVRGDKASLTQLLVILLSNAIKYSPDNSVVRLSTRQVRGRVVFVIADNGRGIPATDLPHVFDRFYRADNSRGWNAAGGQSGYGIGLSIAKLIADLHNAEIVISSSQDIGRSGTTVEVVLPAKA